MIKVLIVDDSATVRRILTEALSKDPGIQVVGAAPDPYVAREMVVALSPDVMTLDIEMPRMDGLSFLEKMMRHWPMPVVVISSLTTKGSDEAMRALDLGAVEILTKPGSAYSVAELGPTLGRTIRAAYAARNHLRPPHAFSNAAPVEKPPFLGRTTNKILAIGASTGGTDAIKAVLDSLPGDTPGTVIVQHMPPMFTASFAKRLDGSSRLRVAEAQGGEQLLPGLAFVAPGGHHLVVIRSGAKYLLELRQGPPIHFQRPAVDVTFMSVAKAAGANAVGVLLTGMGADGAEGLKAMRSAGAHTIGQDEATSVVYGMPKAAYDMGAVTEQAPLGRIAHKITDALARIRIE
jgi:two-component system, chemotaxis family, protein-glutamate methylesterase/glutaminase